MEHPHTLLMLVLKQHYHDRLNIIDEAKTIIDAYKNDSSPNYEKTLGVLYQLMSDLPPDILLYFLTMVPLPEGPMSTSSTLIDLMKQMHSTNLLNNMRPTLLQYLNSQVQAAAVPTLNQNQEKQLKVVAEPPLVQSVIDENIKREKCKSRKKAKPKPRVSQKRCYQVKELSLLCALNVLKYEKSYKRKYENLKKEAWDLVNGYSENMARLDLNKCYNVIRDTNKKMRWLQMVRSGEVPSEIIYDEYGGTDIFYKCSNLKYQFADDVLVLNSALTNSIHSFLSRC